MPIRTEGSDDLDKIAQALREAADKDLNRRVSKAMRGVARPIGLKVLNTGAEKMPQRGGLAERVRSLGRVGVNSSLRGKVTSVSVILRNKGVALDRLDRGILRHPVFGNRDTWVRQSVPFGVFREAFIKEADAARGEVLKAANDTLNNVAKKV